MQEATSAKECPYGWGRIEDQDSSLGWRLSFGARCSVLGLVAERDDPLSENDAINFGLVAESVRGAVPLRSDAPR